MISVASKAAPCIFTKGCLWLLASAWAFIAYTNTYYISSSGGTDGNDGKSAATAWKTLAEVGAQTYGPGDSILLKRGDTWTEKLIIANSNGSSDAPIVLAAYGSGNKPIIQRSSKNGICLLLTDPSWWHFSNISFGPACQGIMLKLTKAGNKNVLVDSCDFNQLQGLSWPGGTNDEEWFVQSSGVGVKGTFTGSPLIENITVKRSLADRCYTLVNVNVNDNSWPGYLVKNLIIEDCKTTQGVHGIWVHSVDGGYADRCTLLSSGSTYFHAGVTGIGIERTRNFDIRNTLVDSVKFQGTDGCAFDFEGGCSNVKVLNCVFKNATGVGFMSYNKQGWANQNCLVEGTTFINCNERKHFANQVNEVLAGTGIMRNCKIWLQNDAQAYQSGGYVTTTTGSRTWTFESNNVVYNTSGKVVFGTPTISLFPILPKTMNVPGLTIIKYGTFTVIRNFGSAAGFIELIEPCGRVVWRTHTGGAAEYRLPQDLHGAGALLFRATFNGKCMSQPIVWR